MAGLVPAIHAFTDFASNERVIQIVPIGIHCMQESHLPCTRPMLDCFLTLNGVTDIMETFVVDKHFQTIAF
jgi:hypothetical protein